MTIDHVAQPKPLRTRLTLSLAAWAMLMLSACGSGLSGEYADETGIMSYDFQSDGKVYMKTLGMQFAGEYEIDDDKVIVRGPNGNMVLERDGDTLKGPMGMVMSKREK